MTTPDNGQEYFQMIPYATYLRECERADRLERELQAVNNLIPDKLVPALITATQAIQASQSYLQSLQYQRDVENVARAQEAKHQHPSHLKPNDDDGLAGVRDREGN